MLTLLLFGATGSAGGSVLHECLASTAVRAVRAIVRRPLAIEHPKLTTVLHDDFADYSRIHQVFASVDACFYCLGKSVSQVESEDAYRRLTHDFALAAAAAVHEGGGAATFHFVSGAGARLNSRFMWARVKAETERDLLAGSARTVCWRPAAIDGMPSASEPALYRVVRPLYKLMKPLRSVYLSGADLGRAMLQATAERIQARIIENPEIRDLADRARALTQLDAIRRR